MKCILGTRAESATTVKSTATHPESNTTSCRLKPGDEVRDDLIDANPADDDLTGLVADALQWLGLGLASGDVDESSLFFDLTAGAQFVAIQALRVVARAAMSMAEVDDAEFLDATTERLQSFLLSR